MSNSIASPVLIIGAGSDIGRALARRYAEAGCSLILSGRNMAALEEERADLAIRYGCPVELAECDVTDPSPDRFFAALREAPGTIVMVAGLLGDQQRSARDSSAARLVMDTNYVGPALLLLAGAQAMANKEGCIIGISSVAGDRGRGSNFIYGAAKAGLTAFLSGLRNSLSRTGIHVMTVKPGFVATRMTAGMKLPPILTATADEVARAILKAQRARKDILYVKPVWRLIMLIIRLVPERLFKKLTL